MLTHVFIIVLNIMLMLLFTLKSGTRLIDRIIIFIVYHIFSALGCGGILHHSFILVFKNYKFLLHL